MSTYTVTATREGSWWVLDVAGVGVTQCARLTEAEDQVRGLIEAIEDRHVPEEVSIEIHLTGPADAAIRKARETAKTAERIRDQAAVQLRDVAVRLVKDEGLRQAEAAVALGVSKQRVTQLLAGASRSQP